jgi:hypothetical protein
MPISLDLDDGQLQKLLSTSLLQSLTQEKKEQLLAQSLDHLVSSTVEKDYSGRNVTVKSPISQAFNQTVQNYAQELVNEYIKNDTVKKHIENLVSKGMTKWMEDTKEQERIVDNIKRSINKCFAMERDYY